MPLRAFWLLLLIGCDLSYAGMFDDVEARKQIAAQQTSVAELRNQVQTLEERILKLEEVFNNQPLLELHSQIENLRLDLNRLQGQIEVLVNENELTQKRQKDFYIDLDSRLRRIEQHAEPAATAPEPADAAREPAAAAPESAVSDSGEYSLSVADAVSEPDADTSAASSTAAPASTRPGGVDTEESRAYETAYGLFKDAKYHGAISHFNKFIKSYPESSLAPSAHYWIGNSYYAIRDFKRAISAQEKLISTFSSSPKVPDAMLNIASSQQEMNDKAAAKKTLERLIAKYPDSEAAEKAKRRLVTKK